MADPNVKARELIDEFLHIFPWGDIDLFFAWSENKGLTSELKDTVRLFIEQRGVVDRPVGPVSSEGIEATQEDLELVASFKRRRKHVADDWNEFLTFYRVEAAKAIRYSRAATPRLSGLKSQFADVTTERLQQLQAAWLAPEQVISNSDLVRKEFDDWFRGRISEIKGGGRMTGFATDRRVTELVKLMEAQKETLYNYVTTAAEEGIAAIPVDWALALPPEFSIEFAEKIARDLWLDPNRSLLTKLTVREQDRVQEEAATKEEDFLALVAEYFLPSLDLKKMPTDPAQRKQVTDRIIASPEFAALTLLYEGAEKGIPQEGMTQLLAKVKEDTGDGFQLVVDILQAIPSAEEIVKPYTALMTKEALGPPPLAEELLYYQNVRRTAEIIKGTNLTETEWDILQNALEFDDPNTAGYPGESGPQTLAAFPHLAQAVTYWRPDQNGNVSGVAVTQGEFEAEAFRLIQQQPPEMRSDLLKKIGEWWFMYQAESLLRYQADTIAAAGGGVPPDFMPHVLHAPIDYRKWLLEKNVIGDLISGVAERRSQDFETLRLDLLGAGNRATLLRGVEAAVIQKRLTQSQGDDIVAQWDAVEEGTARSFAEAQQQLIEATLPGDPLGRMIATLAAFLGRGVEEVSAVLERRPNERTYYNPDGTVAVDEYKARLASYIEGVEKQAKAEGKPFIADEFLEEVRNVGEPATLGLTGAALAERTRLTAIARVEEARATDPGNAQRLQDNELYSRLVYGVPVKELKALDPAASVDPFLARFYDELSTGRSVFAQRGGAFAQVSEEGIPTSFAQAVEDALAEFITRFPKEQQQVAALIARQQQVVQRAALLFAQQPRAEGTPFGLAPRLPDFRTFLKSFDFGLAVSSLKSFRTSEELAEEEAAKTKRAEEEAEFERLKAQTAAERAAQARERSIFEGARTPRGGIFLPPVNLPVR